MRLIGKMVLAAVIVGAGVAVAQDVQSTDPNVIARKELMRANGAAAKALGDMAGGKAPFDAAMAETAKATLIRDAQATPAAFQTQATDASSKAKPEIWANWDDFVAKAGALASAGQALDVSSAESIGAGMQAIGGACMACHQAYRMSQ